MATRAYNKPRNRAPLDKQTSPGPADGWITVDLRGEFGARGRHKPATRLHETQTVKQLISVVAKEAWQCERLLALMRRQQGFLISGNTSSIEAIDRELEAALYHSSGLQRQRQQLIDTLAKSAGFNGAKPEYAQIIATVSIDYGRRLSELHAAIKRTIERLCETKEQNRMLIERSLDNINEFIRRTNPEESAGSLESGGPLGGPLPS